MRWLLEALGTPVAASLAFGLILVAWITINAYGAHSGLYDGPRDAGHDEGRSSRRDFEDSLPFVVGLPMLITFAYMVDALI